MNEIVSKKILPYALVTTKTFSACGFVDKNIWAIVKPIAHIIFNNYI